MIVETQKVYFFVTLLNISTSILTNEFSVNEIYIIPKDIELQSIFNIWISLHAKILKDSLQRSYREAF